MRLFLDAHVSGRRVATALRARGHDVHAADEDRHLDGMTDDDLLALATRERRVLVTFNVRDFARIAREWGEEGTPHAGIMMIAGIDHSELGVILRTIQAALRARSREIDWKDHACFVTRSTPLPRRKRRAQR